MQQNRIENRVIDTFSKHFVILALYISVICVSGFSSEKTGIAFYFVKIFNIEIAFFNTFFPIFQQQI